MHRVFQLKCPTLRNLQFSRLTLLCHVNMNERRLPTCPSVLAITTIRQSARFDRSPNCPPKALHLPLYSIMPLVTGVSFLFGMAQQSDCLDWDISVPENGAKFDETLALFIHNACTFELDSKFYPDVYGHLTAGSIVRRAAVLSPANESLRKMRLTPAPAKYGSDLVGRIK